MVSTDSKPNHIAASLLSNGVRNKSIERFPVRVFVIGTRGIPDIPGGIERHCQSLYPPIAQSGVQVWVATRKPYAVVQENFWQNVGLVHLYAPINKTLETIVHTFLGVLKARQLKADVIHFHGIGPALLVPMAKLLGLTVVMTHHGPDYDRQKWGNFAKKMLRLGEYIGTNLSDEVIVISKVIHQIVKSRCHRQSTIIPNGVPQVRGAKKTDWLESAGVTPGNYILAVSRFVPEKGLDLLIQAAKDIKTDTALVIVGDADHESPYSRKLKQEIDRNDKITRTGYLTGIPLDQLFSHARLFVLPSYHEGLPIALLEAMSYGLSVLVSDIPANLEVELDKNCYFKCGDPEDLKTKIETALSGSGHKAEALRYQELIKRDYNWQTIAQETITIYNKARKKEKNI